MQVWEKNLYVIWAIQILSLAGFGFGIPFLPFYIQELGITDPDRVKLWTGLMASLPGLTMGIMAPIWGLAADRFGRKTMLLRATLAGTLIIGAMGVVSSPHALLGLRIFQGLFTGTVPAAATLVASGTPEKRTGYALGFLSSSTFIGYSLGPLAGGLAAEHLGYRYSFFIGGLILLVAMLLTLFFVRELDNEESSEKKERSDRKPADNRSLPALLFPLLPLMIILVFLRIARTMPPSFLPLRIQEILGTLEGSSVTMGYLSAGAGFFTALSAILLGRWGDRANKLKLIILCALAAALLELPLSFSGSLAAFSLFYIVLAFAAGGIEPQLQALISSRTPPGKRGLLFGIQTAFSSLGWTLAPLLGTWISVTWNLSALFLGGGLFFLASAILGVFFLAGEKN
ncbi:MAG: MFS transporter [Spirochaetales bacterium]|nr:MFS transporter [Spirochaetales bacterium]